MEVPKIATKIAKAWDMATLGELVENEGETVVKSPKIATSPGIGASSGSGGNLREPGHVVGSSRKGSPITLSSARALIRE